MTTTAAVPPSLRSSWADDVEDDADLGSFPLPPPKLAPPKPRSEGRWRQDAAPPPRAPPGTRTPPPGTRTLPPPSHPPSHAPNRTPPSPSHAPNTTSTRQGWTTVSTARRPPTTPQQQPGASPPPGRWESSAPKPAKEGEPELFGRSVFLVGVQGFTDQTLHAFLTSSGVPVSLVRILRSHRDGSLKPYALCVTTEAVRKELIDDGTRVLINPHLPDDSEVDCRTVIPYDARANQDPTTVIMKGSLAPVERVRELVSALGEPRSISIQPRCNAVFVEWDNALAPYMAVELFHGERLEGKVLSVELARA
jgi:hypothetical protein